MAAKPPAVLLMAGEPIVDVAADIERPAYGASHEETDWRRLSL
jgi:hypothetical protein